MSTADDRLAFEDFEPGQTFELGTYEMTEAEILEFGNRWDPQPFHTDADIGERSPFGGVIASGWHTTAAFMRLYVDGLLRKTHSLGSPGVDEIRWTAPVRPGDVLTGRATVEETRPSSRTPERGTVIVRGELVNQDGVPVLRFLGRGLFATTAGLHG
jgi:acyl dehydratase